MECLLSSAKTIRMIRSRMDDMAVARAACMTHGRTKGVVYAEMGCLHDSASCRLGCLIYHHRVENATSSKRGRGCCRVLWESRDYALIAQMALHSVVRGGSDLCLGEYINLHARVVGRVTGGLDICWDVYL